MIRVLLGLTETPTADAADALAIGLTHLRSQEAARLECPPERAYDGRMRSVVRTARSLRCCRAGWAA